MNFVASKLLIDFVFFDEELAEDRLDESEESEEVDDVIDEVELGEIGELSSFFGRLSSSLAKPLWLFKRLMLFIEF